MLERKLNAEEMEELITLLFQNATLGGIDEFEKVKDLTLPDPRYVEYFKNEAARNIYLEEDIDESSIGIVNSIIEWNTNDDLLELPAEQRRPIKIYINSSGGLLEESFAICDAILMSKTPVYTINIGRAMSAAALIFLCGHKRIAAPSAQFLLHLGCGGTGGTYQQTKAQQKNYDMMIHNMKNIAMSRLDNIDGETFENLIDTEWYLYMMDQDPDSIHNARRYNLITEEMTSLTQFAV